MGESSANLAFADTPLIAYYCHGMNYFSGRYGYPSRHFPATVVYIGGFSSRVCALGLYVHSAFMYHDAVQDRGSVRAVTTSGQCFNTPQHTVRNNSFYSSRHPRFLLQP